MEKERPFARLFSVLVFMSGSYVGKAAAGDSGGSGVQSQASGQMTLIFSQVSALGQSKDCSHQDCVFPLGGRVERW